MALEKFGAELLAVARDQGCPLERVLTLGRQNIFFFESEIPRVEDLCGFKVTDIRIPGTDAAFAEEFFRRLGAGSVESMDYSDYQGCDVIHDLNDPIGDELEGNYDLVFDGGTLEHIYHFPNAIANCMRLVKKGGWFLSVTASNNWNGHGLYQFSPELFFRAFDEENGFEVKIMALGEAVERGKIYRVEDGAELGHRVTLNGTKPLFLIFAAQRISPRTPIVGKALYQSDYSTSWESASEVKGVSSRGSEKPRPELGVSILGRIKTALRRILPGGARTADGGAGITKVSCIADCLRCSRSN